MKYSKYLKYYTRMESTRQNKVGRQIQKDISEIINAQSKQLFPGKMFTITSVRVSNDLGQAKIYVSIFPSDESEKLVKELNLHVSLFRNELGNRMRNQVKKIPELIFYLDDSLDYLENIEKLLKK